MTKSERELVYQIIDAIQKRADSLGLDDGAIVVCVHDEKQGTFDELIAAPLTEYGDYGLYENGRLVCDCYGVAMAKMRAATAAYDSCGRHWPLYGKFYKSASIDTADLVEGRVEWNGAVCYPIVEHDYSFCAHGGRLAGRIIVAVSGGTEKQDAICAWSVEQLIRDWAESEDKWLDIHPDYEHRNA